MGHGKPVMCMNLPRMDGPALFFVAATLLPSRIVLQNYFQGITLFNSLGHFFYTGCRPHDPEPMG